VKSVKRSALVMYSSQQMYDLVNDVSNYPSFMDGCHSVEVFEHNDQTMLARLDLKKAGVSMSLLTRNYLKAPEHIQMTLEEGPFRAFRGDWRFTALSIAACKVELDLAFDFSNKALGFAASNLFSGVANNLVDALCKRADSVYGKSDV